ncbi:MAG: DUF5666 domain-containing protein [Bryobacteraceae bacterium]|nr:DUF5666 domain-containing protein [Bryobacteraceae bacterium]
MQTLLLNVAMAALLCGASGDVRAQEQPKAEAPNYEFFSGEITEVSAEKLTVRRQARGKQDQTQTFLINSETRVEGKLAVGARVTVGFQRADGGEPVAVRVIVRTRNNG